MIVWLFLWVARAEVVDRVVAAVDDAPITASEVRLEDEIDALGLSEHPCTRLARPALDRAIDRVVIRAAAGDTSIYAPTEERVAERVERVRASFPDRESLLAWETGHGLDDVGLSLVVRRRLVVERWLERNARLDASDPGPKCAAVLADARSRRRIRVIAEVGP